LKFNDKFVFPLIDGPTSPRNKLLPVSKIASN
jgi:hypothetical protein